MVKVKICGLKDANTVAFTAQAGADWIGFVLIENSPRSVPYSDLSDLVPHCGGAKSVALMHDPKDDELGLVQGAGVDIIQIHGEIAPARLADITSKFGLGVWLAKGIRAEQDISDLSAYEGLAEAFVLDAPKPENSDRLGGNGVSFDWSVLQQAKTLPKKWLLAGGLTPDNVWQAIDMTDCKAVDVSSGVEKKIGQKDTARIKAFIDAAKL